MKYVIGPFMCVFIAFAIYATIDNPPSDIVDVQCKILEFRKGGYYEEIRGRYKVKGFYSEKCRVQFPDGTTGEPTMSSVAPEDCVVGNEAIASVHIGRLSHRLYSVAYINCSKFIHW